MLALWKCLFNTSNHAGKWKAQKISPYPKWDQNMVMSAFGEGGRWALSTCYVFGLQMTFETQRTSVVTHFMLTVCADNFCPTDRTIWQCFESDFAIHKSFLHFFSLSFFSPLCFSRTPTLLLVPLIPFLILLPPSGSRLHVPPMAVNQTMHVSFFFFFFC